MPKTPIQIGAPAPEFRLPDQDENVITPKDLRGKWVVLYFYPMDDTPGCTTEACEFTSALGSFRDLDAEVVGVSPDPPESHRQFIGKHNLGIELLSDPDHEMIERYGAWGEKVRAGKTTIGVLRSTVLIDPGGTVRHRWPNVKAPGHAEAVRRKLQELQGA